MFALLAQPTSAGKQKHAPVHSVPVAAPPVEEERWVLMPAVRALAGAESKVSVKLFVHPDQDWTSVVPTLTADMNASTTPDEDEF